MSAKSKFTSTVEERIALSKLMEKLETYNTDLIGKIFLVRAKKNLNNEEIHIGLKLVELGIYLAHCSIHSGDDIYPAQRIGNVFLLSLDYKDKDFLHDISDAIDDSKKIVDIRGKKAIEKTKQIYPYWFKKTYSMSLDDESKEIMFDLLPVVIKWDHHLTNRSIFGDLWGIPKNTYAPIYDYLKIESFPPAYFVGDRSQNDAKQYVEKISKALDRDRKDVLALSIAHEQFHKEVTNPICELCLPSIYNWWGEGVATTYADIDNYQGRQNKFYMPVKAKITSEIINPIKDKLDYLGCLSTWLAICSIYANSVNPTDIYKASDKLIEKICLLSKTNKTFSPVEIPHLLIPEIHEQELFSIIDKKREKILDMLSKRKF